MKRTLFLVTGAALAFVASAMPAFSADSGTVTATVTAESTCITVTPATVALGTLPFSTDGDTGFSEGRLLPTVTSCTSAVQKLFVRGTDASGGGATWQLANFANPCIGGLDNYTVFAKLLENPFVLATKSDQQLATLAANQAAGGDVRARMPCTGSSGAGVEMSFSVVFTATL